MWVVVNSETDATNDELYETEDEARYVADELTMSYGTRWFACKKEEPEAKPEIHPLVKERIAKIRRILDAYENGEKILYFDEVDRHGGYWREIPRDDLNICDWFCEFMENYRLGEEA